MGTLSGPGEVFGCICFKALKSCKSLLFMSSITSFNRPFDRTLVSGPSTNKEGVEIRHKLEAPTMLESHIERERKEREIVVNDFVYYKYLTQLLYIPKTE